MDRTPSVRRRPALTRVGLSRPAEVDRYLIAWGAWGVYHQARFTAFRRLAEKSGAAVTGIEVFAESGTYGWQPHAIDGVFSFGTPGKDTDLPSPRALLRMARYVRAARPTAIFLPAYVGWSLVLNFAARSVGARIVIMSDTHAATARPGLARRMARQFAVGRASAMLVAGSPQRRYFSSLGIAEDRILDGYDTVDNDFFSDAANRARETPSETRHQASLPDRYFVAVARLIDKKALHTLIVAYSAFRARHEDGIAPSLLIIGTGPLQTPLERVARDLGIPIGPEGVRFIDTFDAEYVARAMALALALVIPSSLEEWGLVVNEAMAAGCPVVASTSVGCVEDLVDDGATGLLFAPGDIGGLASHLERLENDDGLRETLSRGGRSRIAAWGCDRFADHALNAAKIGSGRTGLLR